MQRQPLIIALFFVLTIGMAAAAQSGSFNVTLTVGNSAPVVTWVDGTLSLTPVENATGEYQFFFNATDLNGAADLNDSSAVVVGTYGGQTVTSTQCTGTAAGTVKAYNCSVPIPYYYYPATWSINASVSDFSASYAENTSATFTYNTLKAVKLSLTSLSFSGSAGQTNITPAEGSQIIYNTGNYNFTQMNLTAYSLNGTGGVIGAGNFTVNVTNATGFGQSLVNATSVNVTASALNAGNAVSENMYLWLNVPGGASGSYTSPSSWVIDAN